MASVYFWMESLKKQFDSIQGTLSRALSDPPWLQRKLRPLWSYFHTRFAVSRGTHKGVIICLLIPTSSQEGFKTCQEDAHDNTNVTSGKNLLQVTSIRIASTLITEGSKGIAWTFVQTGPLPESLRRIPFRFAFYDVHKIKTHQTLHTSMAVSGRHFLVGPHRMDNFLTCFIKKYFIRCHIFLYFLLEVNEIIPNHI